MDRAADVEHVVAQELRLLDPAVRRSAHEVAELLHPGFVEFGASGRRWDRASILAALAVEPDGESLTAYDVTGIRLADDVVLVTYVSARSSARARRSSVWRRVGGTWLLYFHQGTPMTAGG